MGDMADTSVPKAEFPAGKYADGSRPGVHPFSRYYGYLGYGFPGYGYHCTETGHHPSWTVGSVGKAGQVAAPATPIAEVPKIDDPEPLARYRYGYGYGYPYYGGYYPGFHRYGHMHPYYRHGVYGYGF